MGIEVICRVASVHRIAHLDAASQPLRTRLVTVLRVRIGDEVEHPAGVLDSGDFRVHGEAVAVQRARPNEQRFLGVPVNAFDLDADRGVINAVALFSPGFALGHVEVVGGVDVGRVEGVFAVGLVAVAGGTHVATDRLGRICNNATLGYFHLNPVITKHSGKNPF